MLTDWLKVIAAIPLQGPFAQGHWESATLTARLAGSADITASGSGIEQPEVVQLGGPVVLPPELPQADKVTSRAKLINAKSRLKYIMNSFVTHHRSDIVNIVNTSTRTIPRYERTSLGWGFIVCE